MKMNIGNVGECRKYFVKKHTELFFLDRQQSNESNDKITVLVGYKH